MRTNPLSPQFSAAPHLKYYGGRVLKNPVFVPVYLGSFWSSPNGSRQRQYLDGFCREIPRSSYTTVWKQYGVGQASCTSGEVVTKRARMTTITDQDLQSNLWKNIQDRRLPQPTNQSVYTLYLPPGVTLVASDGTTSRDGMGGYHSSFDLPNGQRVYYAAIVYSDASNGIAFTSNSLNNITIVASHEWSEAATDPDVNNGKLGWYDRNYGEISDIPINMGLPLEEVYTSVNGYSVQLNWSNRDRRNE